MSEIAQARAIAIFNPTAPQPGFLQPVFAGPTGDNKSYVQIVSNPSRIDSFLPVAWPERDSEMLAQEVPAAVGGESLWSFAFAGESPLVLPWSEFRESMQRRLSGQDLADHPLLQFDIVDTLDLAPLKQLVFTRAFERYRSIGHGSAEQWRDRAILEPALAKALRISPMRVAGPDRGPAYFRARLKDGELSVAMENRSGTAVDVLNDAYQALRRDFPDIFPADAEIALRPRPPSPPKPRKPPTILIVLVGRLSRGRVEHERWALQDVEVVASDHFRSGAYVRSAARLTIILGAQSDWWEIGPVAAAVGDRPALIVTLSASIPSITRNLELQSATTNPTISYFAPFATSTVLGRDPVQPILALVHLLREELASRPETLPVVAQHSLLIREPVRADQKPVETICRLGARALRAGAVLDGNAKLYIQDRAGKHEREDWDFLLQPLFKLETARLPIRLEGRRETLFLLVERASEYRPSGLADRAFEGVSRLLRIRGWAATEQNGRHFTASEGDRRFAVTILGGGDPSPAEEPIARTPALGRAPLLVVHIFSKRQQLLVGNRGQYFHVALEDIAMMAPGTQWVWPILRRQLLESTRLTLEALRLAASLVAEAVRMNRIQTAFVDVDWTEIAKVMGAADCERFVDFHSHGIERNRAFLVTKVNNDRKPPFRSQAIITLTIEDDGPIVSASVDLIL